MSTSKSLILGILDCDELAPELKTDYHNYFKMFRDLLEPYSQVITFKRYAVLENRLPDSVHECNAYLLTGSKTGVYDSEPWLRPLREFVVEAYRKEKKLIGICFGHQLLADALGGKAEKSTKGWGIGALTTKTTTIQATEPLDASISKITLLYSHQDQVTRLPPKAEITQSSEFCPIAGFQIPGKVMTYQGHPEFTQAYSQQLMTLRQSRYEKGQYQTAINTLNKPLDNQHIAKEIIKFISR